MGISRSPKLIVETKDRSVADRTLIKQLQEYHGVGSVVPNNRGGTTAIRFNMDTKKLEYQDSNTWKEVQ